MIRYKVVTEDRMSICSRGKYSIKYDKGEIVKPVDGTPGIFVFSKEDFAKKVYFCKT